MITREAIEERIKLLQSERDQVLANLNAYAGALDDCQYWLKEFDRQDVKEEE